MGLLRMRETTAVSVADITATVEPVDGTASLPKHPRGHADCLHDISVLHLCVTPLQVASHHACCAARRHMHATSIMRSIETSRLPVHRVRCCSCDSLRPRGRIWHSAAAEAMTSPTWETSHGYVCMCRAAQGQCSRVVTAVQVVQMLSPQKRHRRCHRDPPLTPVRACTF